MKYRLFFLSLGMILAVFCWPALAAEQVKPEIQTIQANFTQEKHLRILQKPLISKGTFTFAAPDSLRWEYRSPIRSVLLMHDGNIEKYIERDGELVADQGMGMDGMQVVLTEISSWLDGRFSESEMFRVAFPDEQTVLLEPKNPALTSLISRIELKLADLHGLLDSVTIVEGPDSYTKMTFSDRILNQDIPASVFSLQ